MSEAPDARAELIARTAAELESLAQYLTAAANYQEGGTLSLLIGRRRAAELALALEIAAAMLPEIPTPDDGAPLGAQGSRPDGDEEAEGARGPEELEASGMAAIWLMPGLAYLAPGVLCAREVGEA